MVRNNRTINNVRKGSEGVGRGSGKNCGGWSRTMKVDFEINFRWEKDSRKVNVGGKTIL